MTGHAVVELSSYTSSTGKHIHKTPENLWVRDEEQCSWGSAPDPGIYRIGANLGEEKGVGRHVIAPVSDLGPWDGARVASQQLPCPPPRPSKF
jgi:hypothetical protein